MKTSITILGSTGSIGTQTLDVVRSLRERFSIYALTAGRNVALLEQQAREFSPEVVVIGDETLYEDLKNRLSDLPIKVWAGQDAIAQVAAMSEPRIVVAAMVGFSGFRPTIEAIKAGKIIALANKETLVVGGALIVPLALQHHAPILPVDSEHSAIFQCLVGEADNPVEKLILTASGGPFRKNTKSEIAKMKAADALRHPTWQMGSKITIDSAGMMNKGFEVIEARWLFDIPAEQIDVCIHPESIVHSMVQFRDGAIKAQMGLPDMRLPIQYALTYPDRMPSRFPQIDFREIRQLTFDQPDFDKFPNLNLAYAALRKGGNQPCILNAANEVAVQAFLHDRISFYGMTDLIVSTIDKVAFSADTSLDALIQCDAEARQVAAEMVSYIR